MRYKFNQVFREEEDGRLTPMHHVQIGGVSIGPGITFGSGVEFSGVNIHDFKGYDLEVEEKDNKLVVRGFYKES